jgi:ribonuclease P protein component
LLLKSGANKPPTSIKTRADFDLLWQEGARIKVSPWAIMSFRLSNQPEIRYSWSIPTNLANAVIRNRLKRWIREVCRLEYDREFRQQLGLLKLKPKYAEIKGLDFQLVFRKNANVMLKKLSKNDISATMLKALKQIVQSSL